MLTSNERKIVVLSSLGGLFEFYDFAIYSLFSIYFATHFFPTENQFLSIIQTYAVILLAYIARPLGGIIWSFVGDRKGRKFVLVVTMLLMGLSALGIAMLPTYEQIGVLAPILLVTFRLLQGISLGGELPGVIVYISEKMQGKQGIALGFMIGGYVAGFLLAVFVDIVLNMCFSKVEIFNYFWRIPFLIGGLLCFITYMIRQKLQDSEINQTKTTNSLKEVMFSHTRVLFACCLVMASMASFAMVSLTFMTTYLVKILGYGTREVSNNMLIGVSISVLSCFIIGYIANRVNKFKLFNALILSGLVLTFVAFYLINHGYLLFGLILVNVLAACFLILSPLTISSVFSLPVRLAGVALSYNFGQLIFGGIAPLFITGMIEATGNKMLSPVIYLVSCLFCASIGLFMLRNTQKN